MINLINFDNTDTNSWFKLGNKLTISELSFLINKNSRLLYFLTLVTIFIFQFFTNIRYQIRSSIGGKQPIRPLINNENQFGNRVDRWSVDEIEGRLIEKNGERVVQDTNCRIDETTTAYRERDRACEPASHEYASGSLHKYRLVHLQGASIPRMLVNALIYRSMVNYANTTRPPLNLVNPLSPVFSSDFTHCTVLLVVELLEPCSSFRFFSKISRGYFLNIYRMK